jgi:hypothetical protein
MDLRGNCSDLRKHRVGRISWMIGALVAAVPGRGLFRGKRLMAISYIFPSSFEPSTAAPYAERNRLDHRLRRRVAAHRA